MANVENTELGQIGTTLTASFYIENDDVGVNYDSVRMDSQWADMIWQAHGVEDLYAGDFQSFLSSGLLGYNISNGSAVKVGWSADFQTDGTIQFTHGPGIPGGDFDVFSTGTTLTGNFFLHDSLLDADGDGNANYTLVFAGDLTVDELSDPLTIVGQIGVNNGGNSITAFAGAGSASASGEAYALVATESHPEAVPEPAASALILGLSFLSLALFRRQRRRVA